MNHHYRTAGLQISVLINVTGFLIILETLQPLAVDTLRKCKKTKSNSGALCQPGKNQRTFFFPFLFGLLFYILSLEDVFFFFSTEDVSEKNTLYLQSKSDLIFGNLTGFFFIKKKKKNF